MARGQSEAPCRGRPRSELVRKNVLAAANHLLWSDGFRATTMEAIAARAGAAKGTLYRWWPNRAAIVMDAFLSKITLKVPFLHTASGLADLRAHMRSFCALLGGRSGALLASLAAEGVLDGDVGEAFRARWIAPRRAEARAMLQRAVDAGELGAVDFEALIDALFGPIYYRLLMQHQPLDVGFADALWTLVMDGALSRRPVAKARGARKTDTSSAPRTATRSSTK